MRSERLQEIVTDLAGDLRDRVKEIERGLKTTQDHYGEYLAIIVGVGGDDTTHKLIALALIEAGANRNGVRSAIRLAT